MKISEEIKQLDEDIDLAKEIIQRLDRLIDQPRKTEPATKAISANNKPVTGWIQDAQAV
jgi:hypothetical protein